MSRGGGQGTGIASLASFLIFPGVSVVVIGYRPWFWARGGRTPGMRPFGLRVVRDIDGGKAGGGTAILRMVGLWISAAILYIGLAWVLVDKRRRGWHDPLAGTVVIKHT